MEKAQVKKKKQFKDSSGVKGLRFLESSRQELLQHLTFYFLLMFLKVYLYVVTFYLNTSNIALQKRT